MKTQCNSRQRGSKPEKNKQFCMRVPFVMFLAIARRAKADNVTRAEVVRMALAQWLATFPALLLLFAVGCVDTGTVVNVGPSAFHRFAEIEDGAERMNELLGEHVFSVYMVDSNERIDGEIVVRYHPEEFKVPKRSGQTESRRRGLVIQMGERCMSLCIMHELGHAAGLGHSRDPENMMFHIWGKTYLTESQKRKILDVHEGGMW